MMSSERRRAISRRIEKEISPDSPTWNYKTLAKGDIKLPTPRAGQISIPTWKDELYFEYHRGVFTTQANHKRNMRESEEWLLNAEKYASLAWLDGHSYPQTELTDAWKHVLFNQFHDLAAGSGIGIIYKDAQKDYDQVRWAANEVTSKSLDTVPAHVNTHVPVGSVPVMVVNPLGWDRSGVAEIKVQMPFATLDGISIVDAKGRVLPSQIVESDKKTNTYHLLFRAEEVPSLGYEVLHAVPGKRAVVSDLKADGLTLENAALRVTVDPQTGCITLALSTRKLPLKRSRRVAAGMSCRRSRTRRRNTTRGTSIQARWMCRRRSWTRQTQ